MFRYLIVSVSLALAALPALAEEAGKIIFVAGMVQIVDRPAVLGMPVQEGEMLTTGADGYLYIKTVDNGLFILRPQTRARIVSYHVDAQNSANTRIKLELLSGVARSRSGEAVKRARQNFRFNTPVAAIGVRGTDFTVFTDQDTTRVAVISGGVTVSGLVGACRPEGIGPCEGSPSRELSAAQKGQLLQIQRGQAAPNLMQGTMLSPDMAPPRPDEPLGKSGGSLNLAGSEPGLEVEKTLSLGSAVTVSKPVAQAPQVEPAPVVPVVPVVPGQAISWGRWRPALGVAATSGLGKPGAERLFNNDYFVLFRAREGSALALPERGSAGFALNYGEAYISDKSSAKVSAASLENGQLMVNFDQSTFSTKFDLVNQTERFKMQAQGKMGPDGQLYGDSVHTTALTNTSVNGVLGPNNDASYLFQRRLDDKRTVSGVTYWTR